MIFKDKRTGELLETTNQFCIEQYKKNGIFEEVVEKAKAPQKTTEKTVTPKTEV